MKLVTMPNNDNRHQYWRCHNVGDSEYTNVQYSCLPKRETWLEAQFDEVELRDMTLPSWRLYQVVD